MALLKTVYGKILVSRMVSGAMNNTTFSRKM